MTNKLLKTGLSLILVFFVQSSFSDDLIPAKFFACYGNNHSMQMSPDGKYIAIVTQPRDDKCDIEPDLQKRIDYSNTLAFYDFSIITNPMIYEYSNIDFPQSENINA